MVEQVPTTRIKFETELSIECETMHLSDADIEQTTESETVQKLVLTAKSETVWSTK
jgi:hypothetical protein